MSSSLLASAAARDLPPDAGPDPVASRLDLTVTAVRPATPDILAIRLGRPDGEPLPAWDAGAHVKVRLPDGDERSYSLINTTADPAASLRPTSYLVAVQLEPSGKGGSRFMHGLRPGDGLAVSPPANNFSLEPSDAPVVLVAGGIGVTPIVSMAAALTAANRKYRCFYAGRSRDRLAFLADLRTLAGASLSIHADDEAGTVFDVAGLIGALAGGEPLYLCGPTPMIDAAVAASRRHGWPERRLRFEIFSAAAPAVGDAPFEVMLKSSGRRYRIPPDRTILDVLIEAGEDPLHDCKRGECGICQAGIVEGIADHRDHILSESEKAANRLIQICVSRSRTPLLVLDL